MRYSLAPLEVLLKDTLLPRFSAGLQIVQELQHKLTDQGIYLLDNTLLTVMSSSCVCLIGQQQQRGCVVTAQPG
jgi:hypothetical protein